MKAKNVKWMGIALIAITGLIHFFLAPEYFEEYGALYRVTEPLEPVGLLSLIIEGGFIAVFAKAALGGTARSARNSPV